ncbi:Plasmodium exported protein, unknown function [Plasmodium chabaudi adami]|uniref:Uncharacterized protein n=1 Tax=Plasmodium chabaudi adami TaxID=5826 RepID=A0A1D3RQX2_PLACE|nr:Plasmodium exported protein, unknown function [Plasmodium chabaudi adami]
MIAKISDFLSLFKIFIFTLLIWITYFSNQPSILRISRNKNSQFVTPFALKVTRVLSELSQPEVANTRETGTITIEDEKQKLFRELIETSNLSHDENDPHNIKTKLKGFKYGISIKELLRKLRGFNRVDYVVNELQRDHSIKKLLIELKDFNGFYDLIIALRYADDPELAKMLVAPNNLEKLLFTIHYFNNACKYTDGEYVLIEEEKKEPPKPKKRIPVLSYVFRIIDRLYDKIVLNGALKLYKAYKMGNWVKKVAATIVFIARMVIPVVMGVALVIMLSYLKGIVYYITSVTIIVLSLAYALDKAVKSYNHVCEKYEHVPLELQIRLNMDSVN